MLKSIVDKLSKFNIVELYQQLLSPNKDIIKQRKVHVKVKGGRKKDRVKRYNSWTGKKQLTIDIAGRERYLEGKITYNQAVKKSREIVSQKVIKSGVISRKDLEKAAYENILRLANDRPTMDLWGDEKRPIDTAKIRRHVKKVDSNTLKKMAGLNSYDELALQAKKPSNKRAVYVEGSIKSVYNPYWY
jgi:hypothetical protein